MSKKIVRAPRGKEISCKGWQQEAALRVRLVEPVMDHRVGDLVRHQVTGVHELLGELAEVGPAGHVRAEDVAGRDLRDAEVVGDELGLRPLARARRAHEYQPHGARLLRRGSGQRRKPS